LTKGMSLKKLGRYRLKTPKVVYQDSRTGSIKERMCCPRSEVCPLWDSLQGCTDPIASGQVIDGSRVSIRKGDCIN